jgi:large subunit ribosomal protein L32
MALPKRRHSKTRRNKRRTHYKIAVAKTVACPQCGEAKLPHRICAKCGTYRGREVLEVE